MKIIIIGAGPGGYETALEAAKRGIEVVLVEKGNVGGTCLNEGCIPTKVMCRSAEVLEEMRSAGDFGVIACSGTEEEPKIDFGKVRQRKSEVVEQLRSGVETVLNHKLITLLHGRAVIKDAHTVEVDGNEYVSDYIIVATGSSSASLNVRGGNLPGLLTSREMLDIDHVPSSLCVIGAGVIGLEFASVFSSFGSRVTVIEYCGQILPRFDSDLAKRLKQSLSKRGIEIITSAAVRSVSPLPADGSVYGADDGDAGPSAYRIVYDCKGKVAQTVAGKVLVAVGRRPATDGLGLENAGVEYGPKGIVVDENMRTSCPSVYAIGDVTGKMMLAHVAVYQGLRALNHICGRKDNINLSVVPSAVFTMPEAAAVGLTEDECKEKGIACSVLKSFFRANGKAVCLGETEGLCKIVIAPSGAILGCHILGPHASDLVQEVSALMSAGAGYDALCRTIHIHPTLNEIFDI